MATGGGDCGGTICPTPAEAVPHWEKAVALQDALSYDEPPAWYYPVRESLGAALVRAGAQREGRRCFAKA